MENWLKDIRYAFRFLKRNPSFTLIVTCTLALGIGANTAIFSIINAVLLKPLPFKDPNRLVMIWETFNKGGFDHVPASAPNFFDWKEQSQSFEDMAAVFAMPEYGFNLAINGVAERVPGGRASASLLPVLGMRPLLGRNFLPEEDKPGAAPVMLLSEGVWKRRFGSDPAVIGKPVLVDSIPHTVVGVMPTEIQSLGPIDIWVPTALNRNAPRGDHIVGVLARLKPGVSIAKGQAEMETIARRIVRQMGLSFDEWGILVEPMGKFYTAQIAPALIMLQVSVGLLLLIACANVASLLLARAVSRKQEISIRLALGANRFRLIRQLLTESVVLAMFGGLLGLLLAGWGIGALRAVLPDIIPRLKSMSVDTNVLVFTLGISLLTGILFGLVPAWKATRHSLAQELRAGADKLAGSRSGQRTRSLLLAAEIALTLILAIGAGLLVKSFWQLMSIPMGFRGDQLLTMGLNLPENKYKTSQQQRDFMHTLLSRLERLPGAKSAAAISLLPMRTSFIMTRNNVAAFVVEGHPALRTGQEPNADYRFVSSNYFDTMSIPVVQGRGFTEFDTPEHPRAVVVNQTMVRRHFPNENPIGKRLRFMPLTSEPYEIVGVVGDVRLNGLANPVEEAIYLSYEQQQRLVMSVVVRTATDPAGLASLVRKEILAIDPELPVSDLRPMDRVISDSLLPQRLAMAMVSIFACIALLLGMVGIYGLTALLVNQRTREIGIRMALGARPSNVLRLILRRGLIVTAAGLSLGIMGSWILTRGMAGLLYGVSATDPWVFIAVSLLLAASACLASYLPARRATRIDPMNALRYE
jgi:putative ABC transport system permease protein